MLLNLNIDMKRDANEVDKEIGRANQLYDPKDLWAGWSPEARQICESSDLMKVVEKD